LAMLKTDFTLTEEYDDPCPHCDGEGTIDDPLSSACGGRWFRYCECPAGIAASEEDHAG
jgi:DnaJ-class molecular chaperone